MKRRGSLGLGLALCICGVAVAVAPDTATLAAWAGRYWPTLLVVAGAGALAGFAMRRAPRSPYGGALLLLVGVFALGATLKTAAGPLSLYGRFWPLLLGVIALVEVLKHYTHRPEMGERPALFGAGKIALVGFVVLTGLVSNRLAAADPNLFAQISLPAGLERMRDE